MESNNNRNSFKKLLDRLQENSWELELLVSGFAIFGLFYALDPVAHRLLVAEFNNNSLYVNLLVVVHFSLQILIFNLTLHVVLRGLWIGSLGLRYVFGDIDFDKLNYSEQFTNYLKKNVGSFDDYIGKLENLCSVIFALTFLLIFYIFSFFVVGFILMAFNNVIPEWMIGITRVVFALVSIGALLTLIDFFSHGLMKKNKWVSKFYFPFYTVFSLLTLSFLYRPLVYNLLDNKLGRRIGFGLIPFYLLIYVLFHLQYEKSNFATKETTKASSSLIANGKNYLDDIKERKDLFIGDFAIQSKVVVDPYLRLTIPVSHRIEDALVEFNPSLEPQEDQRGLKFKSEVSVEINGGAKSVFRDEYLRTFEDKYSFKIDGRLYHPEFVISSVKSEQSFESYIGIQDLKEGKHVIEFQGLKRPNSDSLVSICKVPFWYYRE